MELIKLAVYGSFVLNIACGIWVAYGVIQWIREMNNDQ